jgi:hypothetical protein
MAIEPAGTSGADRIQIFYREGESECTGERAWGQFSIFGAIEEKGGHGFVRNGTAKKL